MKKGRRMTMKSRKTVETGNGDKNAESQRAIEKEEITSTDFLEGRNTICTKRTPGIPTGDKCL